MMFPVHMRVLEAAEPYLTYCQVEKFNAKQTVNKYREHLKTWITPHLGEYQFSEIDRIRVMSLRKAMGDKNLSVARQYGIIMTLKSLLRFAIDVLKEQTLDPREVKLPNRGRPHVQVLSKEEIEKMLDNIETHTFTGSRLRALVELLLATGMRISEALSLDRDTFDTEQREIEVIGKGNKPRTIFFNTRCQFWLTQFLDKRYDKNPALFVTTGFEPRRLAREDISRFFVNLRIHAGIAKKVTPHILRHTYCTTLRDNGADISLIKDLAGHQDIATTAKYYIGTDKEQLRKTVDKYLNYGLEEPVGADPKAV